MSGNKNNYEHTQIQPLFLTHPRRCPPRENSDNRARQHTENGAWTQDAKVKAVREFLLSGTVVLFLLCPRGEVYSALLVVCLVMDVWRCT